MCLLHDFIHTLHHELESITSLLLMLISLLLLLLLFYILPSMLQGGFKKVPPKVKKPSAKKSSSAIAAAAAAEAKARAAKKGNKKDKSTFNQVGLSCKLLWASSNSLFCLHTLIHVHIHLVFQLNAVRPVVVSCLAKTVIVPVSSMVSCRLPHDDEHCPLGICPAVDITSAMYVSNATT